MWWSLATNWNTNTNGDWTQIQIQNTNTSRYKNLIQSCEVSFNKKEKRKQERLQHIHNYQIFFSNLDLKYRFISDRNDIGGIRFPLDGFSEMLIKFEYKSELPQFWIEKTYLTLMIVDIVQHQNKLYHNFHIKDPWRGTTAAQIQNQPNNFIGKYFGNQIISINNNIIY